MNKTLKSQFKIGFILGVVAVLVFTQCSTSPTKPWKDMSYAEKEEWVKGYLQGNDEPRNHMQSLMLTKVKEQFQFPEEVEFNEYPSLRNGTVLLADSALVAVNGTAIAKNAFGVKSRFRFQCMITVNQKKLQLEKVVISEAQ